MSALHNLYERSITQYIDSRKNVIRREDKTDPVFGNRRNRKGKYSVEHFIKYHVLPKYIDIIMNRCITRLTYESDIYDHSLDIIIAVLCEALLHFMLTISAYHQKERLKLKMI